MIMDTSCPEQKVGCEYVHSMVDNHSGPARSEVLDPEDGRTCAGFVRAARRLAICGYRIDR